jgi:hypothetical protein
LVIEQLPGTLAHGTCELQAALVFAQVPIDEQSLEVRHCTVASFAHVPKIVGQVASAAAWVVPVHIPLGGLLQVPFVRHCRLAFAWVVPLHVVPHHAGLPPPLHMLPLAVQVPGVVGHCALDPHAAPPDAQVPPATVGQAAALVHDFAVHDPGIPPQPASFVHTVVPLTQVFWLQAPLIVVHWAFAKACVAPAHA